VAQQAGRGPAHACHQGQMHARCVRAVATLIMRAKHVLGSRRHWHNLESRHCGISTVYCRTCGSSQTDARSRSGPGRSGARRGRSRVEPGDFGHELAVAEPPHVDVGGVPQGVTVRRRRSRVKRAAPKFRSTPLVPPFAPTMILNGFVARGLRCSDSNIRPRLCAPRISPPRLHADPDPL
jgi:hypothetical protein